MLHCHHRTGLHLALTVLLVATAAPAAWLPLAGGPANAAPTITVRDIATGVTEVTGVGPGLDLVPARVDGSAATAVTVPGCAPTLEAEQPELPVLARALALPGEGTPRLVVVDQEWRFIAAAPPVPSPGPLSRDQDPAAAPRVFGEVYRQRATWPAQAVELGRPFLVRDRRGVALRIHPVRWDAARGGLEALVSLTVRVEVTGLGGINANLAPAKAAGRTFGPLYRFLFAEAEQGDKAPGDPEEGHGYGESERILIVTAAAIRPAVAELAAWKRECGYTVEVLDMSELGGLLGLQNAVRERFLADAGLAHLILVGDVGQVPTNAGSYQGADSDGVFGLLAGDDLYVDVLVSRLPARNATEAQLMIARTLAYERDARADAGWYGAAAGIASDEGDPADYERAELLRDQLLGGDFTSVARIYESFGGTREGIAAALNGGVSLVNYLGHGSGTAWLSVPFTNADVHQLTNTAAWPWIIDVSCSNGDFSLDECFAEAWLRSTHDGAPAGAVAVLAASTATSWVPPCVMQATIVDHLTAGAEAELGALYAAGVAAVLVQYEGTTQANKLMEQYNLFGDGSLLVRTRTPQALAVSHAAALAAGTDPCRVYLPAGARAVLTAGDQILARAENPGGSDVRLVPARPLVEGETVRLTVIARNALPYRADLPVLAAPTAAADSLPDLASLRGNWPNPFNPTTTVGFALPQAGPVRLTIHDARGRLVRVLSDEISTAGDHRIAWDGRDAAGQPVASGVYLARLETARGRDVLKMTLTK